MTGSPLTIQGHGPFDGAGDVVAGSLGEDAGQGSEAGFAAGIHEAGDSQTKRSFASKSLINCPGNLRD